jgi:hypothetical protein
MEDPMLVLLAALFASSEEIAFLGLKCGRWGSREEAPP